MSLFGLILEKKPSKTIEKENTLMKLTSAQDAQASLVNLRKKLTEERDFLAKQLRDDNNTQRLMDQKRYAIRNHSRADAKQAIRRRAFEDELQEQENRQEDPRAVLELQQRYGKVQSVLNMINLMLVDGVPKLRNLKYQADKYSEDAARTTQSAERLRGQFEDKLAAMQSQIEDLSRRADAELDPPTLAGTC